jgi:hypothetical protein
LDRKQTATPSRSHGSAVGNARAEEARQAGAPHPDPNEGGADVHQFGKLELSQEEADRLSDAGIVERLVSTGVSRLSAERIVAVEREKAEPGRARPHSQARR